MRTLTIEFRDRVTQRMVLNILWENHICVPYTVQVEECGWIRFYDATDYIIGVVHGIVWTLRDTTEDIWIEYTIS